MTATTRAISTVLDASVCLLLVSASVFTLVTVPTDDRSDPAEADETAAVLATSTARVTYEVDDGNRTAHDTLAGLLATATAVESDSDADSSVDDFERAVTERANRTLRRLGGGAQVVARAESSSGALSETTPDVRVVAGERPPPDADVHAAAFSVPSRTEDDARVRFTVRTWSG